MATFDQALQNFQTLMNNLTGMKGGPNYPPESMNQFPFPVVYPANGEWGMYGAAWSEDFHNVYAEIHLTRGNLAAAVAAAMPFYERFRNALANDPTLGGAIHTIHGQEQAVTYEFGNLPWTSSKGKPEQHIGWRFIVRLKMSSTLS